MDSKATARQNKTTTMVTSTAFRKVFKHRATGQEKGTFSTTRHPTRWWAQFCDSEGRSSNKIVSTLQRDPVAPLGVFSFWNRRCRSNGAGTLGSKATARQEKPTTMVTSTAIRKLLNHCAAGRTKRNHPNQSTPKFCYYKICFSNSCRFHIATLVKCDPVAPWGACSN